MDYGYSKVYLVHVAIDFPLTRRQRDTAQHWAGILWLTSVDLIADRCALLFTIAGRLLRQFARNCIKSNNQHQSLLHSRVCRAVI